MSKVIFWICFVCLAAHANDNPLENKYIQTRDNYVLKFKKTEGFDDKLDKKALASLEEILQKIIGKINVSGFSGNGIINLETLQNDGGFGQVDGLRFVTTNERLFITTESLLNLYLKQQTDLPSNLYSLLENDLFYLKVINWDSAVLLLAEMPLSKVNDLKVARAFLAINTQDDMGPITPNYLIVSIIKDNKLYILSSELKDNTLSIQKCNKEWEELNKKSKIAFEDYRKSELKNKKAYEDKLKYDKETSKAYRECYKENAKYEKFYPKLTELAQKMADKLTKP